MKKLLLLLICTTGYAQASMYNMKQQRTDQADVPMHEAGGLDEGITNTYKLVLPDGTSLDFDKKLLEQSGLFKTMLGSAQQAIPIIKYITDLTSNDPDAVSLQDLHAILQVIATSNERVTPTLEKLLLADKPSLQRAIKLLQVAAYFDIKPLYTFMTTFLGRDFAQHYNYFAYQKELANLPEAWQEDIAWHVIGSIDLLQKFMQKYIQPIRIIAGQKGWVNSVTWSPDNTKLATTEEHDIKIWNPIDGTLLRTLRGHEENVNSVAWSPDNTKLASCAGNIIKLWNPADGQLLRTLRDNNRARTDEIGSFSYDRTLSVAWSPDSARLASGNSDWMVAIWNISTGDLLHAVESRSHSVKTVAWSHEGSKLASSGSDGSRIELWNPIDGILIGASGTGHAYVVEKIAWSHDDTKIASAYQGHIHVITRDTFLEIHSSGNGLPLLEVLKGHGETASSVAWSLDDAILISGSWDKTIKLWNVATGTLLCTLSPKSGVYSLSLSPDGTKLASGSAGAIQIWDFANIRNLLKLTVSQITLLRKIINAKAIAIEKDEMELYERLPKGWKDMIAAYMADVKTKAQSKS